MADREAALPEGLNGCTKVLVCIGLFAAGAAGREAALPEGLNGCTKVLVCTGLFAAGAAGRETVPEEVLAGCVKVPACAGRSDADAVRLEEVLFLCADTEPAALDSTSGDMFRVIIPASTQGAINKPESALITNKTIRLVNRAPVGLLLPFRAFSFVYFLP